MNEGVAEMVQRGLIGQFPFQPTLGQEEVIKRLANFIAKSISGDTYVLKGYAGTGKTTLVSALVKTLPKVGAKAVLMAPTGRAAKVMSVYSGRKAFTIHRRIYRMQVSDGGGYKITLGPNHQSNTFFIVDEASMISESGTNEGFRESRNLLKDLIEFVASGDNCRLILIGDTAQLPPVGQESSPALDIRRIVEYYGLRAGHFELTEVVRQEANSGILENATRLRDAIRKGEKLFRFSLGSADVIRLPSSEVGEQLSQDYTTPGPENVIVVCRSNKSANNYNRQIRYSGMWFSDEISAGDYLMCTKNNYYWLDKDSPSGFIANGDMLRVVRVSGFNEQYGFRFADLTVELTDYPDQPAFEVKVNLDSLYTEAPALTHEQSTRLYSEVLAAANPDLSKTAKAAYVAADHHYQALQIKFGYAVTCHKAQGGQWKNVFIDQGYLTEEMLDINYMRWLYTALTRATEKVYLVNFSDHFFD